MMTNIYSRLTFRCLYRWNSIWAYWITLICFYTRCLNYPSGCVMSAIRVLKASLGLPYD